MGLGGFRILVSDILEDMVRYAWEVACDPNVKMKGKAIKLLKQTKVKGTSSVQET